MGIRIVFSLFNRDRALAEAVAAYLLDMQRVAARCRQLLRPGGIAVFVIGNAQLRGMQVDNAGHLARSLLETGFDGLKIVRRNLANKSNTPYRTPTGRLSALPTPTTVYGEEHIIMAQLS
ncbi:hypothetical protein [Aurantimonas sp. 22II-16-19i]|uniref:hypothetical protein n=1 Tax=Aurantimonas sp. 22II-16-19i TaxID=1317114 RepID=UPI001592BC08|nr:hypothetical protein [Aurantimonas sp. 22II-16-19i]